MDNYVSKNCICGREWRILKNAFCVIKPKSLQILGQCKNCNKERTRQWYIRNKDKIRNQTKDRKAYSKEYQSRPGVKKRRQLYLDKWRKTNKKHIKDYTADYLQTNKEEINRKRRERRSKPENKLRTNVSRSIKYYLQNSNKDFPSWTKLPYTPEELKVHLESLWQPWMNWTNYGNQTHKKKTWCIDHIIPQHKLPFSSLADPNFIKCWELKNLRPLESFENVRRNKYNSI